VAEPASYGESQGLFGGDRVKPREALPILARLPVGGVAEFPQGIRVTCLGYDQYEYHDGVEPTWLGKRRVWRVGSM
jgi:hypothetical protein